MANTVQADRIELVHASQRVKCESTFSNGELGQNPIGTSEWRASDAKETPIKGVNLAAEHE